MLQKKFPMFKKLDTPKPFHVSQRMTRSLSPATVGAPNATKLSLSLLSPDVGIPAALVTASSSSGFAAAVPFAMPPVLLNRAESDRVSTKNLEQNNSLLGKHGEIILIPTLSPSQVQTIRKSWKHINTKGLIEIVKKCFQKLENSHSVILSAFVSNENPQSLPPPPLSPLLNNRLSYGVISKSVKSPSSTCNSSKRNRKPQQEKKSALSPNLFQSHNFHNTPSASNNWDKSKNKYSVINSANLPNLEYISFLHVPLVNAISDPSQHQKETIVTNNSAPQTPEKEPKINSMAPTVRNVTQYFLNLLQRIIENDPIVDLELKRVGARHVALYDYCGVGVPEIEKLGEVFADAFLKLDGIRQSKETTRAWRFLIAKIVDHIRDGFETERRYQRRKNLQCRMHSSIGSRLLTSNEQILKKHNEPNNIMNKNNNVNTGSGDEDSKFLKRNSMPSSRITSLRVEVSHIARKSSNF